MKRRCQIAAILLSVLSIVPVASAMDGISVVPVQGNGFELMAYTIQNNAVTGSKVLLSQSQPLWSPSINPSGTHAIFYRGTMKSGKIYPIMSIVNLETNVWKDVCAIEDSLFGYVPVIWWLHDGSAIVWINWCSLWKFQMSKSGSATTVTKTLFGKFDQFPQHQYVDISMDGKIIAYRTYDPACVTTKVSAQYIGPIPASPNTLMGQGAPGFRSPAGCGNAVSPDGSRTGSFGGSGHEVLIYQDVATLSTLYQVNNLTNLRAWCSCGLPDATYGGTDFGHGWSVNSTKWTVVSEGCDNRFARAGAGQFLINASEQKVIDVTRICVDGNGKKAHRGDLWVSNQADVDAAYWTYVQNRDQQRTYWNDIMAGLPDSAHQPVAARDRGLLETAGTLTTAQLRDGVLGIRAPEGVGYVAELFDARGIRVGAARRAAGEASIDARSLARGCYCLRVTVGSTSVVRNFLLP